MASALVQDVWSAVKRHPVVTASIACVVFLAGIVGAVGGSGAPPAAPVGVHGSATKPSPSAVQPTYSIAKLTPSRPVSTATAIPTPTVSPVVTPTVTPHATVVPHTQAPPPVKPTTMGPWKNCIDAKIHGRCNIQRGDPDYAPKLDRDKDGVACEC